MAVKVETQLEFGERYQISKATVGASGFDLRARIPGGEIELVGVHTLKVPTGVFAAIPYGYEGQIRPRSSISAQGVLTHFGTIDSDYRGEIIVQLQNLSGIPMVIHDGDRIAQLVIQGTTNVKVKKVKELDETERGNGGFGSTGRK